jgi:hypothetical protein
MSGEERGKLNSKDAMEIKSDLPSILTKDNESSSTNSKSEVSGSGAQTSGSNNKSILDDPGNYSYDSDGSNSSYSSELERALEESKKFAANQAESSKTGAESSKTGAESSKTGAESSKTGAGSLRGSSPVPGQYIPSLTIDVNIFKGQMEKNVNFGEITAIKDQLNEAKSHYNNSGLPEKIKNKNISLINEKIDACEKRLLELKYDNVEGKGKGKRI